MQEKGTNAGRQAKCGREQAHRRADAARREAERQVRQAEQDRKQAERDKKHQKAVADAEARFRAGQAAYQAVVDSPTESSTW